MVLDHVPRRAGAVVVLGPAVEGLGLVPDDVDPLDVLGAPRRLEDPVGEAHGRDVVGGPHPQEVVDAEDRVLGHRAVQQLVELVGRPPAGAERLLDHDAAALGQAGLGEGLDGGDERGRRQGEVGHDRHARRPRAPGRRRPSSHRPGSARSGRGARRAPRGRACERLDDLVAEVLGGLLGPGHDRDPEVVAHRPLPRSARRRPAAGSAWSGHRRRTRADDRSWDLRYPLAHLGCPAHLRVGPLGAARASAPLASPTVTPRCLRWRPRPATQKGTCGRHRCPPPLRRRHHQGIRSSGPAAWSSGGAPPRRSTAPRSTCRPASPACSAPTGRARPPCSA